MRQHHIAVIGGGLTGLCSSFYLSRRFPRSLISLYENEQRFGGWVRSERVQNVLLEYGPRSLRPEAKSVLELVEFFLC
jgi:oxygen-dependent protoporphyrinogen oxidase